MYGCMGGAPRYCADRRIWFQRQWVPARRITATCRRGPQARCGRCGRRRRTPPRTARARGSRAAASLPGLSGGCPRDEWSFLRTCDTGSSPCAEKWHAAPNPWARASVSSGTCRECGQCEPHPSGIGKPSSPRRRCCAAPRRYWRAVVCARRARTVPPCGAGGRRRRSPRGARRGCDRRGRVVAARAAHHRRARRVPRARA